MNPKAHKTAKELSKLVKQGEGATLEFKRSTGELREGLQTLCALLNGSGGMVLFGVRPDGSPEGQQVTDKTLREIAQAMDRFEPPVNVPVERIPMGKEREVLVLRVKETLESVPFTFDGRPYERVTSTTRKMSQEKYEKLLLERGHARRRWENLPAEGLTLKDLDKKEILRTRNLAIQQNRIPPDTSQNVGDILDRLGLRVKGVLTEAAQVLYGTKFLNDHPQCLLKMGRFRGTKITGQIVDNKQEHMNAFAMVREGMAFLERTMPLGARFPKGTIFREDRYPVPAEALREILLNAVMHRDYSNYSGYVAIVVFDDRIEIQSYGRLPAGVTLKQLSGPHLSKPTNPLIAETFHRTGAVEKWGQGTNRVIEICKKQGSAPPTFEEQQGFLIVTFKAQMVADGAVEASNGGSEDEGTPQVAPQVTPQVTPQVRAMLEAARQPKTREELQSATGIKDRKHFRVKYLNQIIEAGWLERTIPDKPNSRLQKYRLTAEGEKAIIRKVGI